MPIRPYLKDETFAPDMLQAMGEAFVLCCDYFKLQPAANDALTQRVAEAVIEAAMAGAIDTEAIFDDAMERLDVKMS